MAINFELPQDVEKAIVRARDVALAVLRPVSRQYDLAESDDATELKTLTQEGSTGLAPDCAATTTQGAVHAVVTTVEYSWGDLGLLLAWPGMGLGNATIAQIATEEQRHKFGDEWAALAYTEPHTGSDGNALQTTAVLEGDSYLLTGEKIFVTAGSLASHLVVWALVKVGSDSQGIRAFLVPRSSEGLTIVRHDHTLGIKAAQSVSVQLDHVRIPAENLLGSPDDPPSGSRALEAIFTRSGPIAAAQALGVARASLENLHAVLENEGTLIHYDAPAYSQKSVVADYLLLEAEWEAAYLLTLRAAWLTDQGKASSTEASIAKAKAGRVATSITLKAVELAGVNGYSEMLLLEKWARDAKFTDLYEGTQQIQQLHIARRTLGLTSQQLL